MTRTPFAGLFSEIGFLQKTGFPTCELLRKPATGASRGVLEAFFGNWGLSKQRLLGFSGPRRISTREAPRKQNYDQGAYPHAELRPGNWLAGWLAELRPGRLSCAWLAGWLGGWLAEAQRGPERPRKAERGKNKPVMRLAGGSPQADLRPGRLPTDMCMCICVPERMPPRTTTTYVHMFVGFQTEIHVKPRASPQAELRPGRFPTGSITTREALHKQNYDQGAYIPTSRITTRELASWLAGWLGGTTTRKPVMRLAGWLAVWLGVHRGPERPREAQRGGAWIE